MAYSSASDVAALCRNLIDDDTNFNTSTSPTLVAVNNWLSSGCSIIETRLTSEGYSTPVTSNLTIYQWIAELNTLYGAAQAERSRMNIIVGMGERNRAMMFERDFWDGLDRMMALNLVDAGLSKSSKAIYVGGISKADKDSIEGNTDRVVPRFYKDRF